jgi:hypothetical protein
MNPIMNAVNGIGQNKICLSLVPLLISLGFIPNSNIKDHIVPQSKYIINDSILCVLTLIDLTTPHSHFIEIGNWVLY